MNKLAFALLFDKSSFRIEQSAQHTQNDAFGVQIGWEWKYLWIFLFFLINNLDYMCFRFIIALHFNEIQWR